MIIGLKSITSKKQLQNIDFKKSEQLIKLKTRESFKIADKVERRISERQV